MAVICSKAATAAAAGGGSSDAFMKILDVFQKNARYTGFFQPDVRPTKH